MTIKRRLFISNILMIIIPAMLSVLILAGCLLLFFVSAFPHSEYKLGLQGELTEIRGKAAALAADWLNTADLAQRNGIAGEMAQLLGENRMTVQIHDGQNMIFQIGAGAPSFPTKLEQALIALDGNGTVSDGTYELFGIEISANGKEYQVELYNPVVTISRENLKAWAVGIGFFMIIILLFSVFLTNRFLIRFVFRKIAEPLQILAEGVHQIRDGNLTHRIIYTEPDEFQPVCEDFNDMAGRLRASVLQSQKEEEGRKELLASISHDIRSPLTSIRAYVEGLLDGVADTSEKRAAYLSTIQKKAVEMDAMVKKLFLFSKMDMGAYPYSPERLDAVKEIVDFIQASAKEYRRRGLVIEIGSMPQNAVIAADPTYFRSILMNLLDNSAKYKDKEVGAVSIQAEIAGQFFQLYVDDDGPGVPPEVLPKLFDVFYRNDPSRKNPNQGSGLGLAIVWKAIERMDGSICAENLPQGGLRMAIKIPLAERGLNR